MGYLRYIQRYDDDPEPYRCYRDEPACNEDHNNYVERKIKGNKNVEPILSYDPAVQEEHAKALAEIPNLD